MDLFHELYILNYYVVIYLDGQSSICLCKNPIFHERSQQVVLELIVHNLEFH